jgi:low temperature requirement protein LtrA
METPTEPMDREERPQSGGEERVTPLELFFDLVFVLSFTQVTATVAHHGDWAGLGEGILILAAVWWAWAAYGWLTNTIDPDENVNRLCMFAAMGGMVVVSLSIPEAFGDRGVLFGCAYFFVRAMQLILYVRSTRREGDPYNLEAILKLAPGLLLGSALLIVAGALDGGARTSVWILAILIDWSTPLLFGSGEFRLHPGHFAERYGLIVMIALGESVLATGAEMNFELNGGEVIAALLGIAAVAALWWAYFDIVAIVAERRLIEAPQGEQAPMARDAYSYLHFPMIAGIVLLAVGLRETLAHVHEPLDTVPAIALCGGTALYLAGNIGFRLRTLGTFSPHRALATLALLALIPLALGADSLVALTAIALVLTILIAYEATYFREQRARVRSNPSASLAEMRGD